MFRRGLKSTMIMIDRIHLPVEAAVEVVVEAAVVFVRAVMVQVLCVGYVVGWALR